MSGLLEKWKKWAKRLKSETYALYLAYKDPRVPLHAKLFAGFVAAYALSPIDLIPDFIPVLGYLDDLIILPIGIYIASRMIPKDILDECRKKAEAALDDAIPVNRTAAVVIILIWILCLVLILLLVMRFIHKQ